MNTHSRHPFAAAGLLLAVVMMQACGGLIDFNDRELASNPPPHQQDAGDKDAAPRTCPAVKPDPALDYGVMCRHYCATLEETFRYAGRAPEPAGTLTETCYQERCVPKCVDEALCLTQCDALAGVYGGVCGADAGAATDATLCPATPEAQLEGCRAACHPIVPPPPGLE